MLLLLGQTNAFVPPNSRATTTSQLNSFADSINEVAKTISNKIPNLSSSSLSSPSIDIDSLLSDITSNGIHLSTPTELQSAIDSLPSLLTTPEGLFQAGAIALFASGSLLISWLNSPDDYSETPYEPGPNTYDPIAAEQFYAKRPFMVLKRLLRLASLTAVFNTGLLFDWLVLGKLFGDEEYTALRKNENQRAKESLILCQQLGPTFIKLGQALSIRTDLLPELYALELRALQDAVPPFDSAEARTVLKNELGVRDLKTLFEKLSEEPVASASIGQVYRGKLRDSQKDVAVKVQRPGILGEIALDLYVLRLLTPIQTKLQNAVNRLETTQEDIDTAVSLVDEWGRGFVAETDYRLEARNTIQFEEFMRKRNLDAVCAPAVVEDLVRDKVLVTEWVEGTRLDKDASPDVPRLCGVAINAYLTMLLDTGVLHCGEYTYLQYFAMQSICCCSLFLNLTLLHLPIRSSPGQSSQDNRWKALYS